MTDESLIREVDEEVRADEYKKIWDRYGSVFTALAVAVVLGVAGFKGWQYYQQTQSEAAGVVYSAAIKQAGDGKFDDALAALKAVNHPGYGQLARLEEAAVLAEKGDPEKAVAAYDAIAADTSTDPLFANLARIRAAYLLVDTAKPDDLKARVGQFDKDGDIWRNQAREVLGLSAWRAGDYLTADRYMNMIFSDPDTTPAMRQRAQIMVQLIAPNLPKS